MLFAAAALAGEDLPTAPGGSTFQISQTTIPSSGDGEFGPEIATDAAGDFVVVWSSTTQGAYNPPYGYQYDANVLLRRFEADEAAKGDELVVATRTDSKPDVAMDSDGDFVVVWERGAGGSSSYRVDIKGQAYDQDGEVAGGELSVSTLSTQIQRNASVAAAPGGDFAVVWESSAINLNDFDAVVQRYDNAGGAQGTNTSVSSDLGNLNGLRDNPAIGMDGAGNFVVVWHKQDYGNYAEKSVLGRLFGSNGVPVAEEFEIGTAGGSFSANFTNALEVASDSSGRFVVVWEDYDSSGYVTRVMARLYDNAGAADGAAFQVNSSKASYGYPIHEKRPAVVWGSGGGFVIVWDTNYEIFGRRYVPGSPPGAEFRVDEANNPYFQGAASPAIAAKSSGEFVVAWEGPAGPYGSNYVLGRSVTVPGPNAWAGGLAALATLALLAGSGGKGRRADRVR
jgi:hypothetical protein